MLLKFVSLEKSIFFSDVSTSGLPRSISFQRIKNSRLVQMENKKSLPPPFSHIPKAQARIKRQNSSEPTASSAALAESEIFPELDRSHLFFLEGREPTTFASCSKLHHRLILGCRHVPFCFPRVSSYRESCDPTFSQCLTK